MDVYTNDASDVVKTHMLAMIYMERRVGFRSHSYYIAPGYRRTSNSLFVSPCLCVE